MLLGAGGEVVARHQGPVCLLAAGKAAAPMATAAVVALGQRADAVAIGVAGAVGGPGVRLHLGGHPLPTRASVSATDVACEAVVRAAPGALVVVLLSGGASALLVRPACGLTLGDKAAASAELLACGASIDEINTVRKHLSEIKGGGLARLAAPRTVWSLILSDVVGDDVATIGSGPTAADPSTFADAWTIVDRYGLADRVPSAVRAHLRLGIDGERPETPKPGDPCVQSVRNTVIASNRTTLAAAAVHAARLGFVPVVVERPLTGDTTEAARSFAAELIRRRRVVRHPTCVIAGGETTVRVRGAGRGGRNQEFALVAALETSGVDGVDLLSAGTDGIDGPTDAAGAFVGAETLRAARARGLDGRAALLENDSYRFFDAIGGLFRPGPTGTNVMDLKLALVRPSAV